MLTKTDPAAQQNAADGDLCPDYNVTADTLLALHEGVDLYLWVNHPDPARKKDMLGGVLVHPMSPRAVCAEPWQQSAHTRRGIERRTSRWAAWKWGSRIGICRHS